MVQQGIRYKAQIGFATALASAAVLVFFLPSRLQSQPPTPGQPPLVGLPPLPPLPPGPPEVPPSPTAMPELGRPKVDDLPGPTPSCVEELQKIRDEVKRLTTERDQKRAEYQDVETRYREAKKRLSDTLEKNVQAFQRELEATKEDLRTPSIVGEAHLTASPYYPSGVPTPSTSAGTPGTGSMSPEPASGVERASFWQGKTGTTSPSTP